MLKATTLNTRYKSSITDRRIIDVWVLVNNIISKYTPITIAQFRNISTKEREEENTSLIANKM